MSLEGLDISLAGMNAVFYLWRPFLRDPRDDMALELAVTAGCDFIVTYNKHDYEGLTPMLAQYRHIKAHFPDAIVLFPTRPDKPL